jgi:hypothetical protein
MKKIYSYFFIFAILSTILIVQACSNNDELFDDIGPIVTNEKIAHTVSIAIIDANPDAAKPYVANTVVTLEGEAVTSGLISSSDGKIVTAASGSAKVENDALTLIVTKGTVISASQPLKFYVKVEADKYVSNAKEITITSLDSLQHIDLNLLNIASLPEGVANTTASTATVGGTIQQDFVVNVSSTSDGITENAVTATFPANTTFFDSSNAPITTAGNLKVSLTDFNPSKGESIASFPGGVNATTTTGEKVVFIVAGAVDISASIGQTSIKKFSTPIPFDIKLNSGLYNTVTKATLKAGDQLPVWSKDANSLKWQNEGFATVTADGNGRLKTVMQVSHLSTWMVGFGEAQCATARTITLTDTNKSNKSESYTVAFFEQNSNQITDSRVITAINSVLTIDFQGAGNLVYRIVVLGKTNQSIGSVGFTGCGNGIAGNFTSVTNNNPILNFDLTTKCNNTGPNARYDGPIDFKKTGTAKWEFFESATKGTLQTRKLVFGETYDFRVTYGSISEKRTREVVKSEFTEEGNVYNFYGPLGGTKKTFFTFNGDCN